MKLKNKAAVNSESKDAFYFHEGTSTRAYDYLGVNKITDENRYSYTFRVFAPNAIYVDIVGDFSDWKGIPMMKVTEGGVWEAFIESESSLEGMKYKYKITSSKRSVLKADPYAKQSEWGCNTASVICTENSYSWQDEEWICKRKEKFESKLGFYPFPLNIYEFHVGSWMKNADAYLNYRQIADLLVKYVTEMGYTHVELMPISEYPYDGSWGYQVTGYYAPTSRYGTPDDFRYFVDAMHKAGIGVILDWVPAHFPKDEHGLADFDGGRLYEYVEDERFESENWGTRYFNLGKAEVRSFLISNALYWFREFHIDGLRVDAVASMLYLDYDRRDGEWKPNIFGGNQNLEAIEFFKKLNTAVFGEMPDVLMIAEESTAWPMVTCPASANGLGFNLKWNMGWSNDILEYISTDFSQRCSKYNKLIFSMTYAFSENFILPVSHDEVVHGKKSLIDKMAGNYEQKFAGVRTFFGYMMAHPGKKLGFMGCEFGQFREWDHQNQLEWFLKDYPTHSQLSDYIKELNKFYLSKSAFWELDFSWSGFSWINASLSENSVLAFRRYNSRGDEIICIFNFSDAPYTDFEIDVNPMNKYYICSFSSDFHKYGGASANKSENIPVAGEHGRCFIKCSIPPLSASFFEAAPSFNMIIEDDLTISSKEGG